MENIDALREAALKAYRAMEMGRAFDNKTSALYKAGKINGGVFLGRGQEAIAAAQACFLEKGRDVYAPFIREQAGHFAWGDDPIESARSYVGSIEGPMRGHDNNVHWGRPLEGNPAPISHLGAMVSVVAGMMLAKRIKGEIGCVGLACAGDGTTSTGAFHEACNLIAVEKLPIVIVVTNNQFAYSTPNSQEFACESLCDRGKGYGLATQECDGTNFLETLSTLERAISAARRGDGPQWVLANTLRMCGHGEHDDAAYIPAELKASFSAKDCMEIARRQIIEAGWASIEELEQIREESKQRIQQAYAQAQKEDAPNPANETWQATSALRENTAY